MKRISYLILLLPLFLFSCKSTPEASFQIDTTEPEVGQMVVFNNSSHNAKKFEWDFGDGFISNEENPQHIYNVTGTFDVTLTAISKSGLTDKAGITIKVMVPTLLVIEVREYYKEYTVADASVFLYSSLTDWDAHNSNTISNGFTDANGVIVFANLDPFVYYIDVWEKNHDNYLLRGENVDFITSPQILPHQINKFIAWVDYYAEKGASRGARSLIIKKLERKFEDKIQSTTDSGTQDWQVLYNMRSGRK
jgi:PKD repeat protein